MSRPLAVPTKALVPALLKTNELTIGWTLLIRGMVIAVPAVLVVVSMGIMVLALFPVTYTVLADVPLTFTFTRLL